MKKPRIAVFIPAYNEERSIVTVVLLSKKYGPVYVIDDGSSDRTANIAADAGAHVVMREKNGGYGAALATALEKAKGVGAAASVFLDGDFQHEPGDIPRVAKPVLLGKADVGLGTRFGSGGGKFVGAPAGRKQGVALLNRLSGMKNGGRALDYQCGFRAFSRKALGRISIGESSYAGGAAMITSAQESGMRVEEVPLCVRYFEGGRMGALEQAAGLVRFTVSEIAKKKPIFYFGFTGIACMCASALLGAFVVEQTYAAKTVPVGSALLTVFLGIGGLVLVLIGINLYILNELSRRNGGK